MRTKIFTFYLIFILPVLCNGQLNISYNQNTNILSAEYTGCDICALGNPHAVIACKCRNECNAIVPTTEELIDFDNCVESCEDNYSDDEVNLEYCLEACDVRLDARRRICLEACGPNPYPIKEIVSYNYVLAAGWDIIPFDPRDNENPSHWRIYQSDKILSEIIEIPDWVIPEPWPEIQDEHNTCYGVSVNILYDDYTTRCIFLEWTCNIIG